MDKTVFLEFSLVWKSGLLIYTYMRFTTTEFLRISGRQMHTINTYYLQIYEIMSQVPEFIDPVFA